MLRKKRIRVLWQGMMALCLMMFLWTGSALAYKVKILNQTEYKVHVRVHVQKLFSRPSHCQFDLAPWQEATCETSGWCPSDTYATVYKNDGTTVELHKTCLNTSSGDLTCCWNLGFLIEGICYGLDCSHIYMTTIDYK